MVKWKIEIYWGENMQKFLIRLGYFILFFLVLLNLNYIDFHISNGMIIILGMISAAFISLGIFLKDRGK